MTMVNQGDGRFAVNSDVRDLGLAAIFTDTWEGHSFQFYFDAVSTSSFWKAIQAETGFRTSLIGL